MISTVSLGFLGRISFCFGFGFVFFRKGLRPFLMEEEGVYNGLTLRSSVMQDDLTLNAAEDRMERVLDVRFGFFKKGGQLG